ncbi:acyl-[acyl-carrier-protein] thioesterase [Anaerosphaera multitolerans]|uniref:Acyl-ACP thioesterase n=1 Tax=Anaerosphaera multitolerans TaxID=2487351 RepID=A0A437S7Z2_9FIRM|nr:acyl-ACP thioesterase domain-containing protein [Anaerosphaera multitolerans]RVU55195.1 hypothetical protein EF514_02675 [Anaerosphaera multitolerans]
MKYIKKYYIYDFLCSRNKLTYTNLVNILLETSNEQSIINNATTEDLLKLNKTWMIYKWKFNLIRPIRPRETIEVETWAAGFERLNAFREFQVLDENSNIILKASAVFLVVDLKLLKPIRVPEEIINKYNIVSKRNFQKIERIKPLEINLQCNKFKIRKSDIDINGHVNNVTYIDWIEESLTEDLYSNYFISNLNLIYNREIRNCEFVEVYNDNSYNYFEIKTDEVNAKATVTFDKILE